MTCWNCVPLRVPLRELFPPKAFEKSRPARRPPNQRTPRQEPRKAGRTTKRVSALVRAVRVLHVPINQRECGRRRKERLGRTISPP